MKENKLKIQSKAMKMSSKTASRTALSPRNERKTFTEPGEVREGALGSQASIRGKPNPRASRQTELSSACSFTNVAFPRGFTPSQCATLASRQRTSNYIYFKASNNWEGVKPTLRQRANDASRTRNLSPSSVHQVEAKGTNSQSDAISPMNYGRKSVHGKTSLTGYFKWRSKEEIAEYLAAHAHARLLWLQEAEKLNDVESKSGEDLNKRGRDEKIEIGFLHRNPIYLFDKDSRKRF